MRGHIAGTPDGKRVLWYAQPAEHLRPYLTAYDGYLIRQDPDEVGTDVFPPGWGAIRITISSGRWATTIGRHVFAMPECALFGATSQIGFTRFTAGHVVCAGLTPLGWARFLRVDAARYTNRVASLDTLPLATHGQLRDPLVAGGDHASVFDEWFTALLDATPPPPVGVAELMPLLLDPAVATIGDLEGRLAMTAHEIGALSSRHFGFKPKLLLRRARFLRALIRLYTADRGGWEPIVRAAGYHDQSHFVRDSQLFLSMSPSAFLKWPKPLFDISLKLRARVLGTPLQALQPLAPIL